ncbi:hypothetical protein BDY21DRAFT_345374 [Lineolata rhizophorae]|uniref:Uncharacterized protein n=1 Tax=Lineolata rhizophorae TaxID=578093 RepID=A0A6A6P0C3_9PEZI|nr:hypothetical protein BDY21DRAFT_345374 [Lineolata rhizophorae]
MQRATGRQKGRKAHRRNERSAGGRAGRKFGMVSGVRAWRFDGFSSGRARGRGVCVCGCGLRGRVGRPRGCGGSCAGRGRGRWAGDAGATDRSALLPEAASKQAGGLRCVRGRCSADATPLASWGALGTARCSGGGAPGLFAALLMAGCGHCGICTW